MFSGILLPERSTKQRRNSLQYGIKRTIAADHKEGGLFSYHSNSALHDLRHSLLVSGRIQRRITDRRSESEPFEHFRKFYPGFFTEFCHDEVKHLQECPAAKETGYGIQGARGIEKSDDRGGTIVLVVLLVAVGGRPGYCISINNKSAR